MDMALPGGMKITTYHPPRGFDPLTADAADLQKAGFPPRPDDAHHRARYDHVLKRLQGKLNYIPPTLRHNAHQTTGATTSLSFTAPTGTSLTGNHVRRAVPVDPDPVRAVVPLVLRGASTSGITQSASIQLNGSPAGANTTPPDQLVDVSVASSGRCLRGP